VNLNEKPLLQESPGAGDNSPTPIGWGNSKFEARISKQAPTFKIQMIQANKILLEFEFGILLAGISDFDIRI
jgi:hypothetical protein